MIAQLAHRAKAVLTLVGAVASVIVASDSDSQAGHYAAIVLAVLTALGVHTVKNGPKPKAKKKA